MAGYNCLGGAYDGGAKYDGSTYIRKDKVVDASIHFVDVRLRCSALLRGDVKASIDIRELQIRVYTAKSEGGVILTMPLPNLLKGILKVAIVSGGSAGTQRRRRASTLP